MIRRSPARAPTRYPARSPPTRSPSRTSCRPRRRSRLVSIERTSASASLVAAIEIRVRPSSAGDAAAVTAPRALRVPACTVALTAQPPAGRRAVRSARRSWPDHASLDVGSATVGQCAITPPPAPCPVRPASPRTPRSARCRGRSRRARRSCPTASGPRSPPGWRIAPRRAGPVARSSKRTTSVSAHGAPPIQSERISPLIPAPTNSRRNRSIAGLPRCSPDQRCGPSLKCSTASSA